MPDAFRDATAGRRALLAATVAAVIAGTALRFWSESPLWLDEALSVNIAGLGPGDIGEALRRDGHPPLYYWLLWAWTTAFGESDIAARSLSGLIGVLTLAALFLGTRLVVGQRAAAFSVILLATSPFAIRYSTEARMYALVMLLVVLGDRVLRLSLRGDRRGHLGVAVVTGALALTHYWAFFLLAATGLVVLGLALARSGQPRRDAIVTAGSMLAGGAAFAPWVPAMLFQLEHTGTPWAIPPGMREIVRVTLVDIAGHPDRVGQALKFLMLATGAWLAVTVIRRHAFDDPAVAYLGVGVLTAGVGVAAMTATDTAFATRYVAMLLPLVAISLGIGLDRLPEWAGIGAAVVMAALGLAGGVTTATTDRTQSESVAQAIEPIAGPGDLVVFCPDQLGPAFSRALPDSLDMVSYPALGDPAFVDWVDYQERNARADPGRIARRLEERAGDRAIFLVWNTTYRTFEGQCETLADELARSRRRSLIEDKRDVFEPAWATYYPAGGS